MAKPLTLSEALGQLKEEKAKALAKKALDDGTPASQILAACQAGLAEVGRRFETGEYFISELMYAGEMMKDLMALLAPGLKEGHAERGEAGTVVIGTVQGDIHDIGKDIVVLMLRGSGFEVVDLGVDVTPQKFVQAVRDNGAFLVGMSVFLTSCCKAVEQTVDALEKAGLRDKVAVIIGGAAASDFVASRTGCDSFGATAVDAVKLATAAVAKRDA